MAGDQAQLEAALNAIVEPELGLALGELGMVRDVARRRRRTRIGVALPVAAWPGAEELADQIHRVALAVTPGALRTWRKMSRRVGSPNAAETAATAALNRPSVPPGADVVAAGGASSGVCPSTSTVLDALRTIGSLPGDQRFELG